MRPLLIPCAAFLLCLSGCANWCPCTKKADATPLPPAPPREFRAAWVATVANIDWPSKPGLPVARQIEEIHAILDKAVELNLNAIVLQVRTTCDALYASPYEPWSEYLTGKQGVAPVPFYDPLATWVFEAHRRGIELHAWFNPYRARHSGAKSPDAPDHIANTKPEIVRKFHGWEWLDPGEPEARAQTLKVINDVVRRYDIDGVHLDDYFYPYPDYYKDPKTKQATLTDFPDDPSWKRYQDAGGKLARADWRRDNVNRMIHDIYADIKAVKPHVKFGVSPFGIARPGLPETVKAGFDQYATLYADAQLWLNNGWCDYWTPQLYWRLESPQPYADLLKWWAGQNTLARHLWPGLATYRATGGDNPWGAPEIVDQIEVTREIVGAGSGHVHFSMIALMQNRAGINDALLAGPYARPALVPASPWLDDKPLAAPEVQAAVLSDGSVQVTWTNEDMEEPRMWAVWARYGDEWQFTSYPAGIRSVRIVPETGEAKRLSAVSVASVDRSGNANLARPISLVARKKG